MRATNEFRMSHLPALDGLRGIAVGLVLVEHALGGGTTDKVHSLSDVVLRVCRLGWVGVELFFVLSGFLITRILIQTMESPKRYRVFYARRGLRIWPLYYVVLAVAWLAGPHLTASMSFQRGDFSWLPIILFCQNATSIVTGGVVVPAILSVTWSLAIEEQFYLVWPSVVFRASRRTLSGTLLFICLASPFVRFILVRLGSSPSALYYWTLTRLDGLASGALLALYVTSSSVSSEKLARFAKRIAWVGCPTFFLLLMCFSGSHPVNEIGHASSELSVAVVYTLTAISFTSIVALSLTGCIPSLNRVLSIPPLRWLGTVSYCVYLIHLPVFTFVSDVLGGTTIAIKLLRLPIEVALTLGIAQASQIWFERPLLRYKPKY